MAKCSYRAAILHSRYKTATAVSQSSCKLHDMNIDAFHSALVSLTVLPEALRWARENLKACGHSSETLEKFLQTAERDLCIAKATLARSVGFQLSCWPPELLALDSDGHSYCPVLREAKAMHLPARFREDTAAHAQTTIPNDRGRTGIAPSAPAPLRKEATLDSFARAQRERLLQLRDGIIDSITEGAKVNVRERSGLGADSSREDAADAGSDAFDCNLALSLLAQERDALREIDDALLRIEAGSYGLCEISGKLIPQDRLEAIPFARLTVECQAQIEKEGKLHRAWRALQPAVEPDRESADAEEEDEMEAREEKEQSLRDRAKGVSVPRRASAGRTRYSSSR